MKLGLVTGVAEFRWFVCPLIGQGPLRQYFSRGLEEVLPLIYRSEWGRRVRLILNGFSPGMSMVWQEGKKRADHRFVSKPPWAMVERMILQYTNTKRPPNEPEDVTIFTTAEEKLVFFELYSSLFLECFFFGAPFFLGLFLLVPWFVECLKNCCFFG